MSIKRIRSFRKKNHSLLLVSKIALICYVTIFGISYMSSDTSAFLSSQSGVSQTITAGTWPITVLNACGEEIEIDPVTGEEIIINPVQKDDKPKEENDTDALSNEETMIDCENNVKVPEVEGKKVEAIEDEEATEQENEETNELENVDGNTDSDVNIENGQENPVNNVEEHEGTEEQKPVDQDSAENKAPEESTEIVGELNTVVTPGENTMKAEGDTNEREKINEKEENNEEDK